MTLKRLSAVCFGMALLFAQTAQAMPYGVTQKGYLAAVSESALDEAISHCANKDYGALQEMMADGSVIVLKPGLKVYMVDQSGFFGGKEKFRIAGSRRTYWTVREAIKY